MPHVIDEKEPKKDKQRAQAIQELRKALNEDLAREYQAIIAEAV